MYRLKYLKPHEIKFLQLAFLENKMKLFGWAVVLIRLSADGGYSEQMSVSFHLWALISQKVTENRNTNSCLPVVLDFWA